MNVFQLGYRVILSSISYPKERNHESENQERLCRGWMLYLEG